jgi:hypothetical protein
MNKRDELIKLQIPLTDKELLELERVQNGY